VISKRGVADTSAESRPRGELHACIDDMVVAANGYRSEGTPAIGPGRAPRDSDYQEAMAAIASHNLPPDKVAMHTPPKERWDRANFPAI
jgi:hypothetical protein